MSRDKSKTIALLHYAGPPIVGGVESVMRQHAGLMADAGHRVRIIAGRGEEVDPRIRFYPLPMADSLHPEILAAKKQLDAGTVPEQFDQLSVQIEQDLQEALQGVDIFIVHNVCTMNKNLPLTAAIRRIAASDDSPAVIAWHHDLAWTADRYSHELHKGWPWNLVGENWPECSITHVVVSESRRKELCELLGISSDTVRIIPSGLDTFRFHKFEHETAELLRQLPLMQAAPLLLLPVRITRRKNIELALQITAALGETFPDATLVVTGPPGAHNTTNASYFDELLALRSELNLDPATLNGTGGPRAYFLAEQVKGFLPDEVIADLYRIADALLIPSLDEGFGIPLIEAGLSGIPIYCSDISPFREIAKNFASYFSPHDDPEPIAARIAEELRSSRSHALRQRVRRDFSWQSLFENTISPLLEEV